MVDALVWAVVLAIIIWAIAGAAAFNPLWLLLLVLVIVLVVGRGRLRL